MGEQVRNALFLPHSFLSLSIPRVSVAAVLLSVTALLARDDAPGGSVQTQVADPNTLSPLLVDVSRDGNLTGARPPSASQGFLDLKP